MGKMRRGITLERGYALAYRVRRFSLEYLGFEWRVCFSFRQQFSSSSSSRSDAHNVNFPVSIRLLALSLCSSFGPPFSCNQSAIDGGGGGGGGGDDDDSNQLCGGGGVKNKGGAELAAKQTGGQTDRQSPSVSY